MLRGLESIWRSKKTSAFPTDTIELRPWVRRYLMFGFCRDGLQCGWALRLDLTFSSPLRCEPLIMDAISAITSRFGRRGGKAGVFIGSCPYCSHALTRSYEASSEAAVQFAIPNVLSKRCGGILHD